MLEAAANVVLPDNGLPWRKLRENDFSGVELNHLSDELTHVLEQVLESDPTKRLAIDDLCQHPMIAKMQLLRGHGLQYEADPGNFDASIPRIKGAVIEEQEGFLDNVLAEVRHAWHSPAKGRPAPMAFDDAMQLDE